MAAVVAVRPVKPFKTCVALGFDLDSSAQHKGLLRGLRQFEFRGRNFVLVIGEAAPIEVDAEKLEFDAYMRRM